jgi:hypothetical protein
MRTRRIVRFADENRVVWFGSYGMNSDGTAMFFNEYDVHDNFSEGKEMVADSLTQYLSVIEGEIWYAVTYGLPLVENLSKIEMDAEVANIVMSHPNVESIELFESILRGRHYECHMTLNTTFGELEVSI